MQRGLPGPSGQYGAERTVEGRLYRESAGDGLVSHLYVVVEGQRGEGVGGGLASFVVGGEGVGPVVFATVESVVKDKTVL